MSLKKICLPLVALVLLMSCRKSGSSGCPVGLRLTPNDSIPVVGDTLRVYANDLNMNYQWSGPGIIPYQSTDNSMSIPDIRIFQSGWYYCTAWLGGCTTFIDSIYIRVRYAQGTPSCSLANNKIQSTAGVPDFNAALVMKSFNLSWNAIMMQASVPGSMEYDFIFNSLNGNTEPKDGIYYTTNIPIFDSDQDANALCMTLTYGMYYFTSNSGQKVYVSHVNGKLRISFCSIKADDSSGANGLFTGELTEQ
jgi:hypothetical protein